MVGSNPYFCACSNRKYTVIDNTDQASSLGVAYFQTNNHVIKLTFGKPHNWLLELGLSREHCWV